MSHESARGTENVAAAPTAIPHAPPLPTSRPFKGVRDAAYRMIGLPSRPASPRNGRVDGTLPPLGFGRYAALGATQNATTSHKTGLEINTLAVNEKGTRALLGGKELFKTVKIDDGVCVEDLNLRTAIRSTPTQASGKPRQVYSIDIADVAWAKGDSGDYIAAATSSGKIILYDLGHVGLQAAQLHEHYRQVHKVTFSPHRGSLLLSGSQDGTVRLWDVRDARNDASTIQSKRKFSGQSDGVRDVKWSPTEGVDFAFGTDSGWIQRWDIRNLRTPKVRIPAHNLSCNSIDWHPDGKHLVSAGIDKVVRVWDFSSSKRQKPAWEIKTPYPLFNARWRPSCQSYMPQDGGARLCTQIVTAYDRDHPVVHVWDFRRPALPFREFVPYASAPTDLLWHSQDLLWTVGREGSFSQHDIQHVSKVMDRRNLQAFGVSSQGQLDMIVRKRHQRRRPQSIPMLSSSVGTSAETSLSQSPESVVLSRSWADDSLDHSFLSFSLPGRQSRSRAAASRSSAITTPPSGPANSTIMKLDGILRDRQSFAPQQMACRGMLPFQIDPAAFKTMAGCYMAIFPMSSAAESIIDPVQAAFDKCAAAAHQAGQHRLGQTWKIAGFAAVAHLKKRMDAYRAHPNGTDCVPIVTSTDEPLSDMIRRLLNIARSRTASPTGSPADMRPISSIAQALAAPESTSNVPTPLARPVPNSRIISTTGNHLPLLDPECEDGFALLPPSLASRDESPVGDGLHTQGRPLTEHNLQNLENQPVHKIDRPDMAREWSARSRSRSGMRSIEPAQHPPPSLLKHDSNESFAFLAGSQSSPDLSVPPSLADSDGGPSGLVMERPSRAVRKAPAAPPVKLDVGDDESSFGFAGLSVHSKSMVSDAPLPKQSEGIAHRPTRPPMAPRPAPASRDFADMHRSGDIEVEEDEPFKMISMLRELISYYTTSQPNAQIAAQMLLMLAPLLPCTRPLTQVATEANMATYAETLSAAGFSPEDLPGLMEALFDRARRAGLHPLQIESILSTYHDQLQARRLFVEATSLRRLAYPAYPAVYEAALEGSAFYMACGKCKKRVTHRDGPLKCGGCGARLASVCPFCMCEESPFGMDGACDGRGGSSSSLLSTCLLCNHSSHAACAQDWFVGCGETACPMEGCLCDCVDANGRVDKAGAAE